jgi:hypothetical protein
LLGRIAKGHERKGAAERGHGSPEEALRGQTQGGEAGEATGVARETKSSSDDGGLEAANRLLLRPARIVGVAGIFGSLGTIPEEGSGTWRRVEGPVAER